MLAASTYIDELNHLGRQGIPFLFIIDFEGKKPLCFPLHQLPADILFVLPGKQHDFSFPKTFTKEVIFRKKPVNFPQYKKAFEKVYASLKHGDTYLLNLTMPSEIETNLSLQEIYAYANSPFRLLYKDEFVCFSPETFVRIRDGKISSFPMKGTIDAHTEDAEAKLIGSRKEIAEHNTIVDLIRNDLSMVADKVRVKRFRYVEEVKTHQGALLQVSSEIEGTLPAGYPSKIGDIIFALLPAGSISGAPKQKTMEIIRQAEEYERGYYTGVFGCFDGKNMESAVMIRYIEKKQGRLFFKSGGGITAMSRIEEEYQELIDKIYVPFSGNH